MRRVYEQGKTRVVVVVVVGVTWGKEMSQVYHIANLIVSANFCAEKWTIFTESKLMKSKKLTCAQFHQALTAVLRAVNRPFVKLLRP